MLAFNLAEALPQIPGALEDMLIRGAYLEHSARALEHSRHEQEMRVQAVRSNEPSFLFLRPRETRVAYQIAAQDTSADLTAIEQALLVNKRLCDYLRATSEEMLEKWVAIHCDEYRLGLAARGLAVDWEQAIERFTNNVKSFIQVLSEARNLAPSGYDRVRETFSPSAYEAISAAQTAALNIEVDIIAINAIAQEHDTLVGKTVFNDPMPRLMHEPYASVVAQIAGMPLVAAQTEFNRVISAVEDLMRREIEALRLRVRQAPQQHAARTQMYLRNAWNQLHAYAAHSVEPEQVGPVVTQTERAYLSRITDFTMVPA